MTARIALALSVVLSLAACGGEGPIYPVDKDLYEWVKAPTALDPRSDQPPRVADPVVHFRLAPGQRRSNLRTGEDWRIRQNRLFGFDVRLDPSTLGATPITLSRLVRVGAPDTEIATVQLDRTRGITIMGRSCVAPHDLINWHRVEMRIRLNDQGRGFLEAFCDRKPVWGRRNLRTTLPPDCQDNTGCGTPVTRHTQFEWTMGIMADHPVQRPITLQMRRIHQRILLYIPNRIAEK